LPVIEEDTRFDSVTSLLFLSDISSPDSDVPSTIFSPVLPEVEAEKFDKMLEVQAAKAVEDAYNSGVNVTLELEAAEKRLEEHEKEKMAHPPVHMTSEEHDFTLEFEKVQRVMDASLEEVLRVYASRMAAAKIRYDAALEKAGDNEDAVIAAGKAFGAAQEAAIAKQNVDAKAAQDAHDAAVEQAHANMAAKLARRMFLQHENETAFFQNAAERADEELREKLTANGEAKVESTSSTPAREDSRNNAHTC
jgi:hypothetical protein